MIRFCDGTDPNLVDLNGNPCRCKLRFDDVDRMVIYPHHLVGGGRLAMFIPDPQETARA